MTIVFEANLAATCHIHQPGAGIYSFGFETGVDDNWNPSSAYIDRHVYAPADTLPEQRHHGDYVATVLGLSAGNGDLSRVIAGLTIGREYRFSIWHSTEVGSIHAGNATLQLGVTGISLGTAVVLPNNVSLPPWELLTYDFTATAVSHTFRIHLANSESGTNIVSQIDDIQVRQLPYVSSSFDLDVIEGSVTLDERRAPYATADLTLALPSDADLESLNPDVSTPPRVTITASSDLGGTATRTFDLVLHHRDADFEKSRVRIICQSDEALAIDAGNDTAAVDTIAEDDQRSLRRILTFALDRYYAQLEDGTADFDLIITSDRTNLICNPSFQTDTSFTATGTGASARTRVTTQQLVGTASLRFTAAAGDANLYAMADSAGTTQFPCNAGTTYTWSYSIRSTVARSSYARLRFVSLLGLPDVTFDGAAVATRTTDWDRVTVTATVPPGYAKMQPQVMTTGNAAGNQHYIDALYLYEGEDDDAFWDYYFDGAGPWDIASGAFAGDTTRYAYAWAGTANLSASTRTRLDDRDPLLLQQEPGETDWDFWQQLVQAAGLRLFCDESRVWRLVDDTYAVAGTTALAADTNVKRGREIVSRETGDWADAVVIEYRWIDENGNPKVAWAAASAGGTLVKKIVWNRPYPGPDAAAPVLARYLARGRVQNLVALPLLDATPAKALTTQLPHTADQEGFIASVKWDFPELDQASMTVAARDLEDA